MQSPILIIPGLLIVLAAILAFAFSGCASKEQVDALEARVGRFEATQAQQQLSAEQVNKRVANLEQAIAQEKEKLNAVHAQLSSSDAEIQRKVSELEKRLDENSIRRLMATPWHYLVGGALCLLIGIFLGYPGDCTKIIPGQLSKQVHNEPLDVDGHHDSL